MTNTEEVAAHAAEALVDLAKLLRDLQAVGGSLGWRAEQNMAAACSYLASLPQGSKPSEGEGYCLVCGANAALCEVGRAAGMARCCDQCSHGVALGARFGGLPLDEVREAVALLEKETRRLAEIGRMAQDGRLPDGASSQVVGHVLRVANSLSALHGKWKHQLQQEQARRGNGR